jgi:hypothetical protein
MCARGSDAVAMFAARRGIDALLVGDLLVERPDTGRT